MNYSKGEPIWNDKYIELPKEKDIIYFFNNRDLLEIYWFIPPKLLKLRFISIVRLLNGYPSLSREMVVDLLCLIIKK